MIDCIFERFDYVRLSKWELCFVASVQGQWDYRCKLTVDQKLKLGESWDQTAMIYPAGK